MMQQRCTSTFGRLLCVSSLLRRQSFSALSTSFSTTSFPVPSATCSSSSSLSNTSSRCSKKVILIAGPTAVGKSDIALRLAELLNGEIISIDSRQAYQGMEIGTNHPTRDMLNRIPHWLVNFLPIQQEIDVVEYCILARDKIHDIHQRGKVPIVVGGSSFYVQWLLENGGPAALSQGTGSTNKQSRALRLKRIADSRNNSNYWSELIDTFSLTKDEHDILMKLFKENRIDRLARAIEIIENTGSFRPKWHHPTLDNHQSLDYDFRCFFLMKNRTKLYRKIDYRCEVMLEKGFLNGLMEK